VGVQAGHPTLTLRRCLWSARFQVLTAVLLTIQVVRDVTQCRMVNSYRQSERWCCQHLLGQIQEGIFRRIEKV
jgi:hypothetical protein